MPTKTIRWSILFALVGVFLAATAVLAQAAPPEQDVSNGEAIFKAKCTACHTIGGGSRIGPDLKGVTQRRDAAWLSNWIKAPDKMLAAGDPVAKQLLAESNNLPMPNLGLGDADVAALVAYFQSPEGSTLVVAPTQNVPALGSPTHGEALFTGAASLQNGGTHCMACHTVNGAGALGGGALGPDLTHVYARYGRQGLSGALGSLPFPTMRGVFANKALTDSEQADLLAFFRQADKQGQPRTQQNFALALGGGLALAVILLAGMLFFWPRQRMGIAQRLRKHGKL